MDNEINDSTSLLTYLENIKSYERKYRSSENSTVSMLWGVFIFAAGIIDGYVGLLTGYSPHGIVWLTIVIMAILSQQIITTQPLLYEKEFLEEIERVKISKLEIVLIALIFIGSIFVGSEYIEYVMPYIAVSFGLINFVSAIRNKIPLLSYEALPLISFFIVAIVNLVGLMIAFDVFFKFSGSIFGVIVGISVFLGAFLQRTKLEQ